MKLLLGDCLDKLKELPDNSVDAIVTDPPYGLGKEPDIREVMSNWIEKDFHKESGGGFMGKDWDSFVPSPIYWKECLRVLKPGGHILCFAGTRTQDLMGIALRFAGFEIRDCIMFCYGQGFPKSLNISKAIDKKPKGKLSEFAKILKSKRIELGLSLSEADKLITNGSTMYSFLEGRNVNGIFSLYPPNKRYYEKIKEHFGIIGWDDIVENNLEETGIKEGNYGYQKNNERWQKETIIKESSTDAAKQWEGWGTALKPAYEPIILARKPLSESTVAENVLKYGTGGINIDGCRVETEETITNHSRSAEASISKGKYGDSKEQKTHQTEGQSLGRWPANFLHEGSEEVVGLFPETTSGKPGIRRKPHETNAMSGRLNLTGRVETGIGDSGSAARFFYCAKASKKDRDEGCGNLEKKNNHETVKPTSLMQYLCRLITPPHGIILDPFMGSGSTGKAAMYEGFDFIGIEKEEEYFKIAEKRIAHAQKEKEKEDKDIFNIT